MKLKNHQNRFIIALLACIAMFTYSSKLHSQGEFITKWANFTVATSELSFNTLTTDSVSYTWTAKPSNKSGSGKFIKTTTGFITLKGLNIAVGDSVTLSMVPTNLKRFYLFNGVDKLKLVDVTQWGSVEWSSMALTFDGCSNFKLFAIDTPNLTKVTNMSAMFQNAVSFNQNISKWNTANITNMSSMFLGAKLFNQNIGNWNTSNVTNMSSMFSGAKIFNQDIGNWNTSNVTNMSNLFNSDSTFNQNIGNWNTSNVTDMAGMFNGASTFNQNIGNWNTSNVNDMSFMFNKALVFNQKIGNWNTEKVSKMSYMFATCYLFNQAIGNWNTSNVVDMSFMFGGTLVGPSMNFNQDIGNWNTGKVTNMRYMFAFNNKFNQPIGNWNTSNVVDMSWMFTLSEFNQPIGNWNTLNVKNMDAMFSADYFFNQDIGNWNTSNVVDMGFMFNLATIFNQKLSKWNTSNVENMKKMFFATDEFNQDISKWNTANVLNMTQMFSNALKFNQYLGNWILNENTILIDMLSNSAMDCDRYTGTLVGWSKNNPTVTGKILGATGRQYGTSAVASRNILVNTQGWAISGDSPSNNKCDLLLASEDLHFNNEIAIYPNPTTGLINIPEMDKADFTVSDVSGKILSEGKILNRTVSIENLPIGMYFLKMTNTKFTTTKKVWKEK